MSKNKWKKPLNTFLSASLVASLVAPALPSVTQAATNATDLIISEYVEGSSNNKALELYNGTGVTIDLSQYSLELYANGKTTPTKLNLSGTLEHGKTYVIYHGSANADLKSKGDLSNSTVTAFNGNDAIVLKKSGTIIDSIGKVGQDPGVSWGTDVKTIDSTLIRKGSIITGDANPDDDFDPAIEWTSFPIDTFTNLGWHEMDGEATTPVENKAESVMVSTPSSSVPKGTEITLSTNTGGATIYYTMDGSEPTTSSTKYTAPIVIDKDMTLKAFAVADGLANSDIKSFDYKLVSESGVLSISEARNLAPGETVTVKGIVAANLKNTISIQDATGGIAVRPTSLDATVGDEVTVTGKLADYRGLLQLDSATIIKKSVNVGAPTSKKVTGADVNEQNESLLVQASHVTLTNVDANNNYTATDGTTEFIVRDENNLLGLVVGNTYESITGIVQQFDNAYQIIPRSLQDIVEDSSVIQPVSANPGSGTFVGGTTVTLTTNTKNAEILYTLDGKDPIKNGIKYVAPIEIKKNATVKAVVKAEDGSMSEVKEFEYSITDSLQIHDIQGASHVSPFAGKSVENLQGIVTYSFQLSGSTYYHIQTPDALVDNDTKTSEGIILYSGKNNWPIKVGDLVSVSGTVSEYAIDGYDDRQQTDMKVTQINVRNDQGGKVTVVKNNVELPKPIIIDENNLPTQHIDSDELKVFNPETDAIDFWESLEGMRVQVGNVKAVAPQENGDLVTALENAPTNTLHGGLLLEENNQNPNRIQFRLEPNGPARDFEVATGDTFKGPITGVVGYSFQNYKIYVPLDEMKTARSKGTAKPEKTTIVKADDKLTIASYNLENFSNNTKSTTVDKAQKLARAFASDMQSPDIIGVTEVQDNNGEDAGDSKADQSYERLINEISKAGGVKYKYVNIDPANNQDGGAPNANIRVGFLYNPERVTLTEGVSPGNATTAVGYENGKLTYNPGRIDPTNSAFTSSRKPLAAQFDFRGESVIVIANHWNSKSGDTPLFGSTQPPVYGSEVQRHKIANVVHSFVQDIKMKNPEANIVSLGDFNDYQFSESLKIHEGSLMTNMINKVERSDRYTYVYQGNSQVLDHILVSNNLAKQTAIDILHINADFTDMAGRASDHDPVLAQIDLSKDHVVAPIEAEKIYNLKNLKTKKLTITKPSVSITLDDESVITEGILFTGEYAEFHGVGFENTKVTIKPEKDGAIIDFKGIKATEVTIDGSHVKEIRGAENIQTINYENGASAKDIKITSKEGEPIGSPSYPDENRAPIQKKNFTNQTIQTGEELSLLLTDYFSDPDNDQLTFTSTKGTINQNSSTLTLQLAEGSHIIAVTATDEKKSVTGSFTVTVKATDATPTDTYYKDAMGKEGQALKTALHDIIKEQTVLSYDQVWEALEETDEDPNNSNNVLLFYSKISRPKSSSGGNVGQWNREHVWAKSHGDFGTTKGPGTDIHHLRPTDVQVNSSRGNLEFANGGSPVSGCVGCYKTTNSFEPPNSVKGDVARMLFYMATRYEKGDRVDLELNDKLDNGKNPYHGKLSVLLEWNKQDPVDEFEKNRNNVIEKWQGNRNPFIDHPEWVYEIWGSAKNQGLEKAS
ncbi:endonuclease [Peribacillus loiseleuriae]|uniref:Endonuclease/exonuclease/phosphatase n=1 Tax=Peribacillus loiseleuriae TaxID=1679170 RepID=A0A0K9H024_9BACI|nr:endonuclease [Peribacillus loiseleuriae]KMY51867.1 endonuclease/exonuclease/phosphatase [Peribacillus loiseleuriae]